MIWKRRNFDCEISFYELQNKVLKKVKNDFDLKSVQFVTEIRNCFLSNSVIFFSKKKCVIGKKCK